MKIKICLDPGHSGRENRSPVVPEYYESEVMLAYGLRLRDALQKRGFEVVMTRTTSDEDPELQARGRMSEGCACFLSLHQNYADRAGADHVVAIHQSIDGSKTAQTSRELALRLAAAVEKVMGTTESADIRQRLAPSDKNGDGEINDNWYGVLNGASIVGTPGIILEHSFYSNAAMARWMMDAGNQEKLAAATADTLSEYYGIPDWYTVTAQTVVSGIPTELIRRLEELGMTVSTVKTDVDALAQAVIDGKYGNGQQRKDGLGAIYSVVQARVNALLKGK